MPWSFVAVVISLSPSIRYSDSAVLPRARGLRAIIEMVMLEVMYEVPSVEGVSEVIINEDVVTGEGEPHYVLTQELGVPS